MTRRSILPMLSALLLLTGAMEVGAAEAVPDSPVIAEAEWFHVESPQPPDGAGWRAGAWGQNYYAATFGNTFLSRKAFLGAPEQVGAPTVATLTVRVPKAGTYLALVRYEAAPRFQTQFRLRVEQAGRTRLDRPYGARDNVKVWPFGRRLAKEARFDWGAVENVVWEGHDATVELGAGPARLVLTAGPQPEPAARRNIDLVMLTSDIDGVRARIEKEGYLPLDGLLTQAGDLYVRLHNDPKADAPVTLTVPPGIEHSPYWVHQRGWKSKTITAAPGESSGWVEVGSLLDSLNDGQWRLSAKADDGAKAGPLRYALEFATRAADGRMEPLRRFDGLAGDVTLAYRADTRHSRDVRLADDVLYELVDYLKQQPVRGTPPHRTLIFGHTFDPKENDPKYNAALEEFIRLIGATAFNRSGAVPDTLGPLVRGYVDARDRTPQQIRDVGRRLKEQGLADKVAVVSLGDEISLPQPPGDDRSGFRRWAAERGLKPADLDPAAVSWDQVRYDPAREHARARTALFYYSNLYRSHYGIARQKELTDAAREWFPNAGIGANFSPHHGRYYLGETAKWVSLFRAGGMTMPWTEDYAWQVPVGSQQMTELGLDLFRAGLKNQPGAKVQCYVMAHWPGNTPASWRRQFYGAVAHGARVFNLFEFRPVQAAYTENHVSLPAMYQTVRQALHELGTFEDFVQDGHVRSAQAALWFGETGDIWDDHRPPFDEAKRCLYVAVRHQQLPLDVATEADAVAGDLKPYCVLYLTDRHVSRAASEAIARWVRAGGRLFATAGAGTFDEFDRPNPVMRELMGVEPPALEEPRPPNEPVRFAKEDLPFAEAIDRVIWTPVGGNIAETSTMIVRQRFTVRPPAGPDAPAATVEARFGDGSPAVATRRVGAGRATYCGFLPGLSYFKPAIPRRPADRGTTDAAMAHFLPTAFDPAAAALIAAPAADLPRPVNCSEPLVESTVIESPHGLLIPLVNWTGRPVRGLRVELSSDRPPARQARLASGGPVRRDESGGYVLDLEIAADALVLVR